MSDYSLFYILLLMTTGLIAGVVNTLAGGGSNLTIPALMIMGMPPEIANATNRVGVFLQTLVAVKSFKKYDKLPTKGVLAILVPTLLGGILGAASASYMPNGLLKPVLLGAMVAMALLILLKPSTVMPPQGARVLNVSESSTAFLSLLGAGFYGGFVQAGVGFILLAALAGSLRYDLVRANALKMVCTGVFTAVALVIFIARNQISWVPGLILASGTMVGAHFAVKLAINVSQRTLKLFLFFMTLFACTAALFI